MTAARIDLMVPLFMSVEPDVTGSETQEEVPGTTLLAHIKPDLTTLELLLDQDNISTSVVLESGLDQTDQEDQNQEPMLEEKLDSEWLDRVPSMLDGVQMVQSKPMLGETDLEIEDKPHASILRMIDMELGGLDISKVPTTSD